MLRGQVYRVDLGYGPKPWLVVSNNLRNRKLDTVLAARITTTDKRGVPSAVPLDHQDLLTGFVLADDLVQLDHDPELAQAPYLGSLAPGTVPRVNAALTLVLGLT